MRRTRRRAKYTWLPTLGTAGATSSDNLSGREFILDVNPDQSTNIIISPITFDAPKEGDFLASPFTNMGDIIGSEYFLKRIVGKLFVTARQTNPGQNESVVSSALVGAGFFIARANDDQVGGGQDTPIGSATIAERQENYNPLGEDCIREPWIWRRTWVLGNQVATQFGAFAEFPITNANYGSVLDGPHIDAKTARRIKQDERLWFVVATVELPTGNDTRDNKITVSGYLDFRLLGALRKAKQGSAF